jgi:lysophospholipase L1-like esterase
MKLKISSLIVCWTFAGLSQVTPAAPLKVAFIGDSTVATYSSGDKQGWGSQMGSLFDPTRAKTENFARGGTSSKSFYGSSDWKRALSSGAKYLYIQFGHNDQGGDSSRRTDPNGSYKTYLGRFVDEARKKGMSPILVTPLRRVKFSGGKSVSTLQDYASAMIAVAKDKKVPLVDLHRLSGNQYNSWGEKKTLTYFVSGDRTHTKKSGALVMAGLVAEASRTAVPGMDALLKGGANLKVAEVQQETSPVTLADPAPPSNYDPKKDKAYDGYKYRPGQGYTVSKYKLPPRPTCIKEVTSTINVSGTFDGKGCLYIWKAKGQGKKYQDICFAPKEISEGMPPMFVLKSGATLKNLEIECALDGVHTTKNNTIDNVFFRDVEEDAITINENVTVKNSQFWFCNDKCIQMNRAQKAVIENNKFYYTTSAVLANWGRGIEVRGNFFYNTKKAIRSYTKDSYVITENNSQDGGDCHLVAQSKGILEDWGTGSVKNVKKTRCEEGGGKIVSK